MSWGRIVAGRGVLSALLVIGALLFVVGVAAERGDRHSEPARAAVVGSVPVNAVPRTHVEGSGSEESEAATTSATELAGQAETPGHPETGASVESSEGRVLGVNLESNGVVGVGVILSVVLAALVWSRRSKIVIVAVGAFTVAFAVFDIAEVIHQANGSHRGVAVLAALVAVAHLAAATVAAVLLRTSPSTGSAATST